MSAAAWWARARRPAGWAALVLCAAFSVAPAPAQRTTAARTAAPADTGAWNGAPRVLRVNEKADLAQPPAGSMVFWYLNRATLNNEGELALTSGGGDPLFLPVEALSTQPGFLVQSWKNAIRVTNVSLADSTPIEIRAMGPGMPGLADSLAEGPPGLVLAPASTAQGATEPRYMQLVVQADGGGRSVVAVIGGPVDSTGNNAYVIAVNDTANTGPPGTNTGEGPSVRPPPPGYYATTTDNQYVFSFRWNGASVWVGNLSSSQASPIKLVLRAL
ncbi:MAG TPA: hypothetical protein VFJ16_28590 [Longimicrobium sp.]|nr:hypothetical protein [Longimicrobium sp.]